MPYRLAGAAAFFQRAEVRDLLAWLRLLVDPGDAGAVVRALARPPVELRAIDLARVHPDRPPAQARHGRRARRRARVAADPARGARADPHVPQALPRGRRRARLHAPRPLRAPADRAARAAPPAAVRRLDRGRRAAASTSPSFAELAAAYVRRSPQATAREFARSIAAVAEAGLREEEAVAGERPRGVQVMTMHAAKGLEFDHVYVLGLMGARMPGPAPAHARADPRRADQGGASRRDAKARARRRDAAAAARRR